ncbi:hypothetical protein AMTRI_Chr11g98430 [Amborella trichopoda]
MRTLSLHLPPTSLSLSPSPTHLSLSNPMAGPSLYTSRCPSLSFWGFVCFGFWWSDTVTKPTDDVPIAQKLETAMARILGNLSFSISLNLPLCPPSLSRNKT